MRHKYFFHRKNEPLKADTVIYYIWVGESDRDQHQLALLKSYAAQIGATLRLWSEDIDFYLMIESERVFPALGLLNFGFVSASLSVCEAVKHANAEDWDVFENSLSTSKSYFHVHKAVNPLSVDAAAGRVAHAKVLTSERKYLSRGCSPRPFIIKFK